VIEAVDLLFFPSGSGVNYHPFSGGVFFSKREFGHFCESSKYLKQVIKGNDNTFTGDKIGRKKYSGLIHTLKRALHSLLQL
jgi:hypothetical protein